MTKPRMRSIDQANYIRSKLYHGNKGSLRRYSELVVGKFAIWKLIQYELTTSLLGPLPGSVGLVLRRIFYPRLFREVGGGVVFGRNLVVRNADRIRLGDRVVLDDHVLLDACGSGEEGIVIGDEVIVNRGASIQSKLGPISIGSHSDIGAGTTIVAQGGVYIGSMVSLAGGCKVGGGLFRSGHQEKGSATGDPNDLESRGHQRSSQGPIRIGDRCLIASHGMVLDGAQIGHDSIVAPGAIVMQNIPPSTLATLHQRLVLVPRQATAGESSRPDAELEAPPPREFSSQTAPETIVHGEPNSIVTMVLSAIDELNEMRPADESIPKEMSTPLFGPAGLLDSMELVNLVVLTEQKIQECFGASVNLAGQETLSGGTDYFATIESFVDHIASLLPETTTAR